MKRPQLTTPTLILAAAILLSACGERGQGGGAQQNASQQNTAQSSPAQAPSAEIEFAREALRLLTEGDARVEEMIDWDNFVSLGDNLGTEYRRADDAARAQAREEYVKSFSSSFKEQGGAFDKFANWREASREPARTVVAADMPTGGRLLVTVAPVGGRPRVTSLAAEQADEDAGEDEK